MTPNRNIFKKVRVASFIMILSVLLSRVIGLLREMAIAYYGGTKADVDAYQIAFVIPEILNHIVASGFLSVTFIPIFTSYLANNKEEEAWQAFSVILTIFGLLLMILIGISWIMTPFLINIIAPGLTDPTVRQMAIRMTQIILPAQFFFFTGGMFMAVQFAKEKFLIPAFAPLLYNLGIISGGVLLSPFLGIEGFSWGVLYGSCIGNFVIQYVGSLKIGMRYSFTFQLSHPDLKKYIQLTLPLMLGLTMTFSTEFFLKFFGSFLPAGNIAALNYGFRMMLILVGCFGQAIGVASFPFMARLAAEKKHAELNQLLNTTLKYLALIIPFSVLIIVLRHETVLVLFQRGRFDSLATLLTSQLLPYLMVGTVAFAAQTVVVRGYYAVQNTIFPAVYGTIAVIISLPIYYYGMKFMGARGIALAISISAIFQVLVLYILWNSSHCNSESKFVFSFYAKMIFLSIPIGLTLEAVRYIAQHYISSNTFVGSLILIFIVGSMFLILMGVGTYLGNIKELIEFINKIKIKLKRYVRTSEHH